MTIDISVGVSNTTGYSYTGADSTITDIPGMGEGYSSYTAMSGGGKSKRGMLKKFKKITRTRLKHMKHWSKNRRKTKRLQRKKKAKQVRKDIILSIEQGKPLSKKTMKKLTPSMKSFLEGIDTKSSVGSTLRFSDFKSDPGKKKKKKGRSKGHTRGGGSEDKKRVKSRSRGGAPKLMHEMGTVYPDNNSPENIQFIQGALMRRKKAGKLPQGELEHFCNDKRFWPFPAFKRNIGCPE